MFEKTGASSELDGRLVLVNDFELKRVLKGLRAIENLTGASKRDPRQPFRRGLHGSYRGSRFHKFTY